MALALVLAAGGIATFGSLIGFILAILIDYACSRIAASKGRGTTLWAILGFFFTLIALIVILVLPSKTRVGSSRPHRESVFAPDLV